MPNIFCLYQNAYEMKKIHRIESKRFNYIKRLGQASEIQVIEFPNAVKEFDENGNVLLDLQFDNHGNISEKIEFAYKEGKLIKKTTYIDEDEVADISNYHYDTTAKLSYVIVEFIDGTQDKIVYKYNSNGNLINKASEDGEGSQEEMRYENNLLVYHKIVDDFDELEREEFRTYSIDGKLVEMRLRTFNEGDLQTVEVVCDAEGRTTREMVFNSKSRKLAEKNLSYDSFGNLIKIVSNDENGLSTLEMIYDSNNNEIEQIETNDDGEIQHQVKRTYSAENEVIRSEIQIFNYGRAIDLHYVIETNYTYF